MATSPTFNIDDVVQISADEKSVKKLQVNHGGWVDAMSLTIGKIGKICRIYQDLDVRVEVDDSSWTFNPACLKLIKKAPPKESEPKKDYPLPKPPLAPTPFIEKTVSTPPRVVEAIKSLEVKEADKPSCPICYYDYDNINNKMIAYIPCGHTACSACAKNLKICPQCRKPITNSLPIFI